MKEMVQSKFLMGVVVFFLISLYISAGVQKNIEAKNDHLNENNVTLNLQ